MVKLIVSEFVSFVIVTPIVFYLQLLIFNEGKPEASATLFGELLLYTEMNVILVFFVPLLFSILLDRFYAIRNREFLKIYSPMIYICIFVIISDLNYIILEKFFSVYSKLPYPIYYLFYLLIAAFAYFLTYFLSREKGALK